MTLVLVCGVNERDEQTKRRFCVTIDNMCKLTTIVRGPPLGAEVRRLTFEAADSMSDPDCRETEEKAQHQLDELDATGPCVE